MAGTPEERERAEKVATYLGTYISGDISLHFWTLPILEQLVERIDDLDVRLRELEGRMGE